MDDLSLAGWDFLWATFVPNLKFVTSSTTDINGDAKCRKRGGLGWLRVIRGYRQCHYSIRVHTSSY